MTVGYVRFSHFIILFHLSLSLLPSRVTQLNYFLPCLALLVFLSLIPRAGLLPLLCVPLILSHSYWSTTHFSAFLFPLHSLFCPDISDAFNPSATAGTRTRGAEIPHPDLNNMSGVPRVSARNEDTRVLKGLCQSFVTWPQVRVESLSSECNVKKLIWDKSPCRSSFLSTVTHTWFELKTSSLKSIILSTSSVIGGPPYWDRCRSTLGIKIRQNYGCEVTFENIEC